MLHGIMCETSLSKCTIEYRTINFFWKNGFEKNFWLSVIRAIKFENDSLTSTYQRQNSAIFFEKLFVYFRSRKCVVGRRKSHPLDLPVDNWEGKSWPLARNFTRSRHNTSSCLLSVLTSVIFPKFLELYILRIPNHNIESMNNDKFIDWFLNISRKISLDTIRYA